MKRALILFSFLALQSVQSFRQHAPPHPPPRFSSSDSSSMSSEEDSFEQMINRKKFVSPDEMLETQKKQQPQPKPQPPKQPEGMKNKFFDRPSSEELEAYEEKVQRQNKNRVRPNDASVMINEQPVIVQGPVDPEMQRKQKLDDADAKMFMEALGEIYLQKVDDESRERDRFPAPAGPMGPPGPPLDIDYFYVPYEEPGKKESNNNGNNNVHVNVNHVQVNSNVLHVPAKDDKKPSELRREPEPLPMAPAYHFSEPVTTSKYLYLNLNMTDVAILIALVAAFLFAIKKAYSRCFPKKQVAPQLPTTLPPTYTPSTVAVETTSKKIPQ
ncbi:unnamed protein product [Caenorhabditis sp. 36 PRJEB53466]|nr:unnamed protein product [Caenorhabditis sp. 36 PRJEB53466]